MHLRSQYSPHSVLLFFPGGRHIGNQLLYVLDLQLYIPFQPFSNKSCDICNIKYWPHLPVCTGVQVDSFYLYICTTVQVDPTYLYVLKYRLTLLPVCTGVEVYSSYLCVVVYRLSPPTCVYWCTGWPLLPVCTGVEVDPSYLNVLVYRLTPPGIDVSDQCRCYGYDHKKVLNIIIQIWQIELEMF